MWTVFIWPSMILVSIKYSSLWQINLFHPTFDEYCTGDWNQLYIQQFIRYYFTHISQTPLTGCDSFYKIKKSNVLGIGGFLFVWNKKNCKLIRNLDEWNCTWTVANEPSCKTCDRMWNPIAFEFLENSNLTLYYTKFKTEFAFIGIKYQLHGHETNCKFSV